MSHLATYNVEGKGWLATTMRTAEGTLVFFNVYLASGEHPHSDINASILGALIGVKTLHSSMSWIAAGDWNAAPADLVEWGVESLAGLFANTTGAHLCY